MSATFLNRYTGPVLMTCAAILGAATLSRWEPTPLTPFSDGATQMALEDGLNKAVPIRDISISGWNSLRYSLFGEMLEGGVAGTDGWLYTAEEYRQPPAHIQRLADDIATLITDAQALTAMGIDVTITLVPDKARVAPQYTRHIRSAWIEERYDTIRDGLEEAGIRVVDLRPALYALGSEAFLRQDTHWSAQGAKAAAQAIAAVIGEQGEAVFTTVETGTLPYNGDLTNFVAAGRFAEWLGLGPIDIPQFTTTQDTEGEDTALSLFGDSGPIAGALVGTSYSAVRHWNFLGALKEELQADILDYSTEGKGPFTPMQDYLAGLEAETAPEFLIWEVPERYLTVTP